MKTAKTALTLTVAEFLKGHLTGVGRNVVQYLWVPANALGRDAANQVVIAGSVDGSTSASPDALCVCLSRGGGDKMKILAVGGLAAYGMEGIRKPQRRPGEIYLGETPHALTVQIGKVNAKHRPATLGEALPGSLVCVHEKRNAKTPNLSRGKHMIKRDTPLMHDGTGLLAVYVGDEAFVRVDGVWGGYDVVPEHPSLAQIYSPAKTKIRRQRGAKSSRRRRVVA